jgi:activator of HSP90 ATPase
VCSSDLISTIMVVHNPNNWHWVDKNCLPWTKQYFEDNIKQIAFEDDQYVFTIVNIDSITGDCDVTQRKGKVLCIYDMLLKLSIEGLVKDSEKSFTGSITVPEFVHDQDEDEYVFEIVADDYSSQVRKSLVPVLLQKLLKFQNDLITAHESDVQHQTD